MLLQWLDPPCCSSPRGQVHMLDFMKLEEFASLQDAFDDVVKYFGENPKTTPPSVFFPVFVRFVKAYKVNSLAWCWSSRGCPPDLRLVSGLRCCVAASPVPSGSRSRRSARV